MVSIGILKPEEAARRALANVAKFKKEEARKALEVKVRPQEKKPVPVVENKEELNKLLWENAKNGNKEDVERLLKAGADVDAKDNPGNTALMIASLYGQKEIAELLIAKGADVDAKNEIGSTALLLASTFGQGGIAALLRASGATE